MTTTDQEQLRLPTDSEIEEAKIAFQVAIDAVTLVTWRIYQISSLGTEKTVEEIRQAPIQTSPTFEDIGRLFNWLEDARMDLEEITNEVERAAKGLVDIDYVREIRSRENGQR
jgi:hypothetical protein